MSMIARFVAVAPKRLDELRNSPQDVEALFAVDLPSVRAKFTQAVHERIRNEAPEPLRRNLDRAPPGTRAQFLRNFGVGESDLAKADVGELLVKRFAERIANIGTAPQSSEAGGNSISLDTAWHGLHYLLSGSADPQPGPLGQAVFGGTPIGEDLGCGPARCFTAAETSAIGRALQAATLETGLRNRFDAGAMEKLGIYPNVWHDNPDWLIDAFRKLRDFYSRASAAAQAVVTTIQ
ncbi:MAG TPA: YfbM family protein [Micropepsaceae bacterium]|nr:YfbM family protein [Micropepsaceae bacterium]